MSNNHVDGVSDDATEEQLEIAIVNKRELLSQMVGTLYRGIVRYQILLLDKRLNKMRLDRRSTRMKAGRRRYANFKPIFYADQTHANPIEKSR